MSFTYLGGTGNDDTYYLRMFVYPNTSSERWECENTVRDALAYFGDQLHAGDAITKWRLYAYDGYPGVYAPDKYTFKDNFDSWLAANDLSGSVGVHLGVSDNFGGGLADGGDYSGYTGFSSGTSAVAGIDASTSFYQNTAIQETAHPVINNNLDIVESMLTHDDDEHELGKIYSNNDASPMTSGYGTSTSQYGECRSGYSYYGDSTNITNCTNEAVKYTARDER